MFDICLCHLRPKIIIMQCAELKERFSILKPIKLRFFDHGTSLGLSFPPKRIAHSSLEKEHQSAR